MSDRVSILIKTFERQDCLAYLLESVRRHGLRSRILIADDSRRPYGAQIRAAFPDLAITYCELPFDVGLSAGRNRLLEQVETELFLLMDDDYRVDRRTDIERAIRILEEKGLDVLGGLNYDYKTVRGGFDLFLRRVQMALTGGVPFNYLGDFEREGDRLTVRYYKTRNDRYLETDIVLNFFVARTEKIRSLNPWDEQLKFDEHTEFFLRAKLNGLRVAYTPEFGIGHCPVKLPHYTPFTDRGEEPLIYMHKKHGIREWRAVRDDGETQITIFENGRLSRRFEFERSLSGFRRRLRRKRRGQLKPDSASP